MMHHASLWKRVSLGWMFWVDTITDQTCISTVCFKSVKPNSAVLKNALRKPGSPFYQRQSCCTDCHIHENRNRPEADPRCIIPMTSVSRNLKRWPQYGCFQNLGGTPQWMVSFLKSLVKWMIWGYTHFRKHPYVSGLFFFATQILRRTHDFLIPLACTYVQGLSRYVV